MHGAGQVLIIGPRRLGESVAQTLPDFDVVLADRPLEGVWQAGQRAFDGVVVSLGLGQKALRVVHSVRRLTPNARIVVSCAPSDEPDARRALEEGADDYALEPLNRAELERALGIEPAPQPPPPTDRTSPQPAPAPEEIVRLSEVLRTLERGPQATVDALAPLLRDAFDAVGAYVQIDDLQAAAGDVDDLALEELLVRDQTPVGRVALARRRGGAYPASAGAALGRYATLVLAAVDAARRQERLRLQACTDDVSGLHNRRYFDAALSELLGQASSRRQRLTVLLFDLDDFKTYNDRFGHETGDALLREVGQLLRRCTRTSDVVARYGGDEFAVVFVDAEEPRVPGSQHPTDPEALAERFRRAIHEHDFHCLGRAAPGPLTISGGLAAYPWDGTTRESLMRAADEALMSAKRVGKNRIQLSGGIQNGGAAPRDAEG